MSKTRTDNEAPAHKYFTQMLNIAEDDLDPFQYRLLAHYVRWTGHGGESDESIRTAAKATRMGVNKIRSTLEELTSLGYIAVERPTVQEARNGKTIHITILDRWLDNITRYQGGVSNKIQGNAKTVSDSIQGGVSNKIRLEEQSTEKQKETKSADAPPSPRSNPVQGIPPSGKRKQQRSEKSTPLQQWLSRLPAVKSVVCAMLTVCYEGWDSVMMSPENSLTVQQLEKYITNADEFIRLGGAADEVGQVYEFIGEVDYSIAPQTIAGFYLRWKAQQQFKDIPAVKSVDVPVKVMTDGERALWLAKIKADKATIFG